MLAANTSTADTGRKKLKSVKKDLMEGKFKATITSAQRIYNVVDWHVYENVKIAVQVKTTEVIYPILDAARNRYEER